MNNNLTSINDCLTQNDKNAIKDIVTGVTPEQIEVSIIGLEYIASEQPHNNTVQRDVQHKNPQTLKKY